MTGEVIVIGLVRLLGALPVLRWPLAGGLVAVAVDFSDLVLMNYLELGGLPDYQAFDKCCDLFYLATFMLVALRWRHRERSVAVALLGLRLLGIGAFEMTHARPVLFAFPNLFEFWFLFVAGRDRFAPDYVLDRRRSATALAGLLPLKWAQEYLLHVDRRLDNYLLSAVVSDAWRWLQDLTGQ